MKLDRVDRWVLAALVIAFALVVSEAFRIGG